MSNLLKLPLNKTWRDARNARLKLYNDRAWYSDSYEVRDAIHREWERLTLIMRQEEQRTYADSRKRYHLPR